MHNPLCMQGFNLHAWISHATNISCVHMDKHAHSCVCMCAYTHTNTHIFRIGGEERRALHLAQSLC